MKPRSMIRWTWLLLVVGLLAAAPARAFYNPQTGHWLSRDPIEESGRANSQTDLSGEEKNSANLYGFISNESVDCVDVLGLALYAIDGTWMNEANQANPWQLYNETTEKPKRLLVPVLDALR